MRKIFTCGLPLLPLLLLLIACRDQAFPAPATVRPQVERPSSLVIEQPASTAVPISFSVSPTKMPTPIPISTAVVIAPTITLAPPASPTPRPEATATPTPQPAAADTEVTPAKIGFHLGPTGGSTDLGEWMRSLDAAGIPFFLKSADSAGGLYEAQKLAKQSGVPHTLVYRRSGGEYELPDYSLNPVQAAREHWERHIVAWPPELDPDYVWMETINEPDQTRSEWLAMFALETARLAVRDGRRWAAFGWATGEPEPSVWEGPAMQAFLRYAGEHPENVAIALHEYSLTADSIDVDYPFLVGRFQWLYLMADHYNIPRPTVLITEWGWTYRSIPGTQDALEQIEWVSQLYDRFPQVKGAALWYLGGGWGSIDQQVSKIILPVRDMQLRFRQDSVNDGVSAALFMEYYKDHPDEIPENR